MRLLLLALITALPACSGSWLYTPDRPPQKVLLPDGFVGWTRLDYATKGAPTLPRDGEYVVVRYPETGHLTTSSRIEGTYGLRELFYYAGDRIAPVPPGFQINGGFTSQQGGDAVISWFAYFGTEKDATAPHPPVPDGGHPPLGQVVPSRRILLPTSEATKGISRPDNNEIQLTKVRDGLRTARPSQVISGVRRPPVFGRTRPTRATTL